MVITDLNYLLEGSYGKNLCRQIFSKAIVSRKQDKTSCRKSINSRDLRYSTSENPKVSTRGVALGVALFGCKRVQQFLGLPALVEEQVGRWPAEV